ncbi:MAG: FkbM family methyltransferase [Bacteroidia bacterium]
MSKFKDVLRKIVASLPIALTQNIAYDKQTQEIMKLALRPNSNCIDIGCHKGEVLEQILELAPQGQHFGFEPIPQFYQYLTTKFSKNCNFYQVALSDKNGEVEFNYVVSNPAYSGIEQREYPKEEEINKITVKTQRLDEIIPQGVFIDLIKIDVEGAEFQVLKGATELIKRCKPLIVFEHGLGAADKYGTTPDQVYDLLVGKCGMQLGTLKGWLKQQSALSKNEFESQFNQKVNYYFIAFP